MSGTERKKIRPGLEVQIVQKQDQRSGLLTTILMESRFASKRVRLAG
jgi:uncharacterized repeat protein (TIGR03833 family)